MCDYFNSVTQYTMVIEWIGYHLASTLTKFIGSTSNFECNWKDFANATTPWLHKEIVTSTMRRQLNFFPYECQAKGNN
jgi:hypothetical protein